MRWGSRKFIDPVGGRKAGRLSTTIYFSVGRFLRTVNTSRQDLRRDRRHGLMDLIMGLSMGLNRLDRLGPRLGLGLGPDLGIRPEDRGKESRAHDLDPVGTKTLAPSMNQFPDT